MLKVKITVLRIDPTGTKKWHSIQVLSKSGLDCSGDWMKPKDVSFFSLTCEKQEYEETLHH